MGGWVGDDWAGGSVSGSDMKRGNQGKSWGWREGLSGSRGDGEELVANMELRSVEVWKGEVGCGEM